MSGFVTVGVHSILSYYLTTAHIQAEKEIKMSDSVKLTAGLTKTILRPGHGPPVQTNEKVTVHCVGMLEADRKKFWR